MELEESKRKPACTKWLSMQNTKAYHRKDSNWELVFAPTAFAPLSVFFCFSHLNCYLQTDATYLCKFTPYVIKFQYVLVFSTFSNPVWNRTDSQKQFALLCNCVSSSPRLQVFLYSLPQCGFTFSILSGFTGRCFTRPRTLKPDALFYDWHQWNNSDIWSLQFLQSGIFVVFSDLTYSAVCRMLC